MEVTRRRHARTAALAVAGLITIGFGVVRVHTAEVAPAAVNAILQFSPTSVSAGQSSSICAVNFSRSNVTVAFILADPSNSFVGFNSPATIAPGQSSCGPELSLGPGHSLVPILASIELKSPKECSGATEYPGKCRVLGSLEISGDVEGTLVDRIHLEPTLLPALPAGLSRLISPFEPR